MYQVEMGDDGSDRPMSGSKVVHGLKNLNMVKGGIQVSVFYYHYMPATLNSVSDKIPFPARINHSYCLSAPTPLPVVFYIPNFFYCLFVFFVLFLTFKNIL